MVEQKAAPGLPLSARVVFGVLLVLEVLIAIFWRPIVLKMDRWIRVEAEGVVIADGQKRVYTEVAEVKKSEYPAVFFKKERIPEVFMKIRTIS